MTPSPAPDRLTALIDEVHHCGLAWATDDLSHYDAHADFITALAALRAEAASMQTDAALLDRRYAMTNSLTGKTIPLMGREILTAMANAEDDAARATTSEGNHAE